MSNRVINIYMKWSADMNQNQKLSLSVRKEASIYESENWADQFVQKL